MGIRRKMVNMNVVETSGVDHPAHLQEGWVVAKSSDGTAAEMFEKFLKSSPKEQTVPEITEADVTAAVEKAVADAVAPLTETITSLTAERDEAVAKAAAVVEPVVETDADPLEKALGELPAPVREMLAKQATDLAKAQEDVRKERETRLDGEAIAKSRETYKSLGIDHDVTAPALRRLAEDAPEVAKAIETALASADAQADSGRIFAEIGSRGQASTGGSAMTKAREVAKSLVAAGTVASIEQGVSKAFSDDPSLYEQYRTEKDA